MKWLDICEQDQAALRSYESFLKHNDPEALLLPPELAEPFSQAVHIRDIQLISQEVPLTSHWIIARLMVEHAWRAASDPDPDQTINLHGDPTLLYTVPVTKTRWAVCALQSYWNDWDEEPAHAIYAQEWGLQDTPTLAPRDPAELWRNREQHP